MISGTPAGPLVRTSGPALLSGIPGLNDASQTNELTI